MSWALRWVWSSRPRPGSKLDLLRAWALHGHRAFGADGAGGRLHQRAGVVALFAGPPGTGKTMAAQALARQLDLELLRVELSQVVNKYIGETEKNLDQLFDAAEAVGAMLFFDEADALYAVTTAVLLATTDGELLGMRHLVLGVWRELRKCARLVPMT